MTCEHLQPLEQAILAAGIREDFRGKPWSDHCREWVYFSCCLDRVALRERFHLDPCVKDHEHMGTHDGQEAGFFCTIHEDGIMGVHPKVVRPETQIFGRDGTDQG